MYSKSEWIPMKEADYKRFKDLVYKTQDSGIDGIGPRLNQRLQAKKYDNIPIGTVKFDDEATLTVWLESDDFSYYVVSELFIPAKRSDNGKDVRNTLESDKFGFFKCQNHPYMYGFNVDSMRLYSMYFDLVG